MENQRLDLAMMKRDHEVEVLSREGRANPSPLPSPEGRGRSGKNRIDQRMPLEFVTNSFLPSEERKEQRV
jgi:hypothetical protein